MAERQALTTLQDKLEFATSPRAMHSMNESPECICEGWFLKKRRKMLQGYARRYFTLHSSGFLSYSFEPGSVIRDQIFLPTAAISSSLGRKDIHVDSERITFHLKCISEDDFRRWMDALRKFTAGAVSEKPMLRHTMSRTVTRRQSVSIQRTADILDRMGNTIDELFSACSIIEDQDQRYTSNIDPRNQPVPSRHRDKELHPLLSLFKKTPSLSAAGGMTHSNFARDTLSDASHLTNSSTHFLSLVTRLREEHSLLSESFKGIPVNTGTKLSSAERSHEDEMASGPVTRHQSLLRDRVMTHRHSMSTVASSASIWYDAVDEELGAEEYVVYDNPVEDELMSGKDERETDIGSSLHRESDGENDANGEDDVGGYILTKEPILELPGISASRRVRLPATQSGEEGSLFSILKKNVGQDLSNIAFPVTFNEPLTLLQRSAEEMEYHELLNKAAASSNWEERICYIAAFAVSGYACTKYRSGRKGLYAIMYCEGETFEDTRMNFIAEKVVHKPLLIAFHADGPGWELNGTSSGKTKFWGKSFEIIPTGITEVQIGNDVFEWNKPSSFTRNLMMGTKYLEHCGEMAITNVTTGARCIVDFKGTGYWTSTTNVVTGTVYSPDGDVVTQIEGKWDERISQKLDASHFKILWRINSFPRDTADYYGFTYFGMSLNEILPDLRDKLPCTDSRYRPDVRALEEGDIALAESEKMRMEQTQRERRQLGQEPKPQWFRRIGDSDKWVYAGGYWEARNAGWKTCNIDLLW